MPKAQLIHYTGKGHLDPLYAGRLLVFTKNTRMNMTSSFETAMTSTEESIKTELSYMANTIPSSWEFVDVVFLISEVSRATAQQITRTRQSSIAMQSQRVTDMSDVTWDQKTSPTDWLNGRHDDFMKTSIGHYKEAIDAGFSLEDARDLLPIGVHCNLVMKYNLRTFVELCKKRDSLRVQGPYVEVVRQMKEQVLEVWPWAEPFFKNNQQASIDLIEEVAVELKKLEATNGAMYNGLSGKLAKAADKLKES